MTTGQRIAQKRKELGLSQEALGERLGVSRQAIYKWESDSALPEIEKLVALSRLSGASVGWLLGTEEESAPEGGELTEAQVKILEELAARYAPRLSPRRLAAVKSCVAAGAVFLCIVLYGFSRQLNRLTENYYHLQTSISEVRNTVDAQVSSVSNRVEEILKSQNDIAADYGMELLSVDPASSSAVFWVYAVPKNYVEGMTAEFSNYSRGRPYTVSVSQGQRFETELKCGLLEDITLSVDFVYPDGTRQTQLLNTYHGLYGETFPEVRVDFSFIHRAVKDGALVLSETEQARLDYDQQGVSTIPKAPLKSVRVGLFKNRRLVDWAVFQKTPGVVEEETAVLTGEQWDSLDRLRHNGGNGTRSYQLLNVRFEAQEIPLEAGDVIQVAAVLEDVYGRTAIRAGTSYGLDADWNELGGLGLEPPDAYPAGWIYE